MEKVSVYEVRQKGKLATINYLKLWKDRQSGMSYGELAKKYGISRGTVWLAIQIFSSVAPIFQKMREENARLKEELKRLKANGYDDKPY